MTSALSASKDGLVLSGLDGSNPLAFLAALGTLRTLTLAWPEGHVKMSWIEHAGAWRPIVIGDKLLNQQDCTDLLHVRLIRMNDHLALSLGDNLSVTPEEFRAFARQCVDVAHHSRDPDRRIAADFAAAFACDVIVNEQGGKVVVQDTALRTMSGAGHQHFLAFMRHIVKRTTDQHLHKALFLPWKYDDPVTNQTLRWDPSDDSRYALQWRDPSGDPARKKGGAMLGANRLAIEGLPLTTCAPSNSKLRTVGFTGRGAGDTYWTWPIWTRPVSVDVCRSLLAIPDLTDNRAQAPRRLRELGVLTAFRSRRITIGKFRNFTPATAIF
ncbi:MAG TPA: hypothetical protein VMV10_17105 [Pirellulales bacterium]|nr:hypothetical protein [Pirellulales bacterium]